MSAGPSIMSLAWIAFALVIGAIEITASILLVRERNPGPWIMLAGAILSLVAHVATQVVVFTMNQGGNVGGGSFSSIMSALTAASVLGTLLFVTGLLFFAFSRRALAARVAELESILRSRPPQ